MEPYLKIWVCGESDCDAVHVYKPEVCENCLHDTVHKYTLCKESDGQ